MDFFDEMSAAINRDAARRGVRVNPDDWQRFMQHIVPAAAAVAVENTAKNSSVPPEQAPVVQSPVMNNGSTLPDNLNDLRYIVLNCGNCPLAGSRQNVVFGEGNEHARLMFIGEGPGADEDASGRPFVGAAGQLLDKMINAMHLAREEVYIANIVKCRPPGNRMPGEEEAAACIGYLRKQIALIKPEVIVLLGGTALHFLLQLDGITRFRGRWQDYHGIAVMPTFHPAFLLRKPESKREAWHDLKLVMTRLGIQI